MVPLPPSKVIGPSRLHQESPSSPNTSGAPYVLRGSSSRQIVSVLTLPQVLRLSGEVLKIEVQKTRFLSFVTGSDLAPVGGLQERAARRTGAEKRAPARGR